MKKYSLLIMVFQMLCNNICNAQAVQSNVSKTSIYANFGFNYGIQEENLNGSDYSVKTKLTPQGGVGIRKSNKKNNRFVDIQIGVATANNYLKRNNENILLGAAPNEIGADKGIHTFMLLKLSGLQSFTLAKNKNYLLKAIVGTGLQYLPLLSNNFEEVFDNQNNNYFSTYILYDFKYVKENNNYTPKYTKRPLSLHSYIGVQYFPTVKKLKNVGVELFWNPSITPTITGSYDVNLNFASYTNGNANQMLHSFGFKVLYTFNVYEK
jgi:hypothetical protein